MIEAVQALVGLAGAVVVLWVIFVLPAKRRANMTPEQRELDDLRRRTRRLERKHAWRD